LELSALVEEMAQLLQTVISKRARLRLDLARDLPLVEGDATQIRQVVMNLITNASDALGGEDGEIAIRTGVTEYEGAAQGSDVLDTALEPGRYVFAEVRDTGHGMTEETLSRIFEPFFTTKFTGRGLGLAATLGIVRGHRGTIRVDSAPGRGTAFRVLLPAMADGVSEAADDAASAAPGTGAVLVVDDDPTVRGVATQMLSRRGYQVLTAADGVQALGVFARERSRLALVFVDLTMPRMSGEEVIREMKRVDPAVRVILMSGFSEQELARKVTEEHVVAFLQKPFRIAELDRVLRRAAGETTPDTGVPPV
jgi:CheY-like chemotaxis protein